MLLAGAKILGADLQDTVSVDQEFHFDARQSGGRGRHAQSEARKRAAVFCQFAFTLENVDVDAGLTVDAGSVKFLRASRYRGIARNNFCNRSAVSFDAEREGRDIEQQHGFDALVENIGLNGGPERHDFVGIQLDVRLAIEKLLHGAANQRRARGAADKHDFVHLRGLELGVRERLLDGPHSALNHGANEGVERTAGEFMNEHFAVRQRETKRGRLRFGKPMLYVDQRFAKFLRQFAMRRKVDFIVLENQFVGERLQQIVDVVAAQVRVAIGGKNLEDIAIGRGDQLEDGNVECASAKIVNGNFAALFFVEAIGQRGRSGFVDETENFEAGNSPAVLGGLALRIIEIGRYGDDGAVDGFAEMRFCPVFQLAKNESGNFRRGENSIAEQDTEDVFARGVDAHRRGLEMVLNVGRAAAHEALDGINGSFRLREGPFASRLAHDDGSIRIQANHRRT